jgi:hypothetical protein
MPLLNTSEKTKKLTINPVLYVVWRTVYHLSILAANILNCANLSSRHQKSSPKHPQNPSLTMSAK